ncbi:MAG TPA: 2-oxoglutarate dehydrogenase E1 component, partial [Longimicrobiales bacterium]|nr:2-oxoglutarate dehydrogenase E1 component [Longimicrobiales bacterium]
MEEPFFDSSNAAYAQAMFEQYARNPESVPEAWRRLFADGGQRATAEGLFVPDQLNGHRGGAEAPAAPEPQAPRARLAPAEVLPGLESAADSHSDAAEHLRRALPMISRAAALIQAFRDHGHQLARIDPLGSEPVGHPQLNPAFHGTTMEDLALLPSTLLLDDDQERSVADALEELKAIYSGTMGYEFEHLDDHGKVDWLWEQVETGAHRPEMSAEQKQALLRRLSEVEGLEQFLGRAYLGQKRFSVEGNDTLVPMLDLTLEEAARSGGREAVIGMAHRGRLNVLTHVVGVSYGELLAEFEGPSFKGGQLDVGGTGDVKYHHGARGVRSFEDLGAIDVTLMPNPSHLEFVNPVVNGFGRARQFDDTTKHSRPDFHTVLPIVIHGDAAFSGEGVVAETLNMARLRGYDVGGTIHIIANNQVGFTTDPRDSRSTFYASDLAKGYGVPVVHVNADDPEACLSAVRLAMAYRNQFKDDFVIDLVGYRRHGHNEGDEPGYTQPVLYKTIGGHPTVRAVFAEKLRAEGVVSEGYVRSLQEAVADTLREAQDGVRDHEPVGEEELDPDYETPVVPESTGVGLEALEAVNTALVDLPEGFTPHPKLWRQLERRAQDFGPDKALDWGHAESLAFGSLLLDGIPIRLTGQDAERGTFSHRHLILHDVETGDTHSPLQKVAEARFEVYNSPLTETAAIGFEYGYSVGADTDVVLWEAQFGDFVNVAQVMIDQFLAAGLAKWGQYSRLTLLLPHGYEGQGPE